MGGQGRELGSRKKGVKRRGRSTEEHRRAWRSTKEHRGARRST